MLLLRGARKKYWSAVLKGDLSESAIQLAFLDFYDEEGTSVWMVSSDDECVDVAVALCDNGGPWPKDYFEYVEVQEEDILLTGGVLLQSPGDTRHHAFNRSHHFDILFKDGPSALKLVEIIASRLNGAARLPRIRRSVIEQAASASPWLPRDSRLIKPKKPETGTG